MNIRNRINLYLAKVLSSRIWFTTGPLLVGKSAAGEGFGGEITIGTGLTLSGGVLSATSGVSDVGDLTTDGLTAGNMLRVSVAGGLEERTPAEVASDIGVPALTFAGSDPNIPENLTIAGSLTGSSGAIATPIVAPRIADSAGYAKWSVGDLDVEHIGSDWWVTVVGDYGANKTSTNASPVGLTGWTVGLGTGQPTVAGDAPVATHLGQLCKASTAWWQWDGTVWVKLYDFVGDPVSITAPNILDKLKGAEDDPTRIGAEHLPEQIDVNALVLADGSDVTLDNGSFTGGADDRIYRHNGVDLGGLPYAPLPRNTVQKVTSIPTARYKNRVALCQGQGTILTDGTVNFTITSSLVTGSPKVVPVSVLAGDKVYDWLEKAIAVLNADTAINPHFTFTQCAGVIQMQEVAYSAGAATFNCNIANGTATGVTSKTSVQTQQYTLLKLAEIPLPASEVVNGKKFFLGGTMQITLPSDSVGEYKLIFRSEGQSSGLIASALASGTSYILETAAAGGVISKLDLVSPATFSESAGLLGFNMNQAVTVPSTSNGLETSYVYATGAANKMDLIFFGDTTTRNTIPSVPSVVEVYILAPISGTAVLAGAAFVNMTLTPVDSW